MELGCREGPQGEWNLVETHYSWRLAEEGVPHLGEQGVGARSCQGGKRW